jgi:hypothetical protein
MNCSELEKGDILKCNSCGFTIEVKEPCTCDDDKKCDSSVTCCGAELVKA